MAVVTPALHDPGVFYETFVSELERRGSPQYPSRPWWLALGRACQADETARVTEKLEQAYSCYDAGQLQKRRNGARDELICYEVGAKCTKWLRERKLEYDFH